MRVAATGAAVLIALSLAVPAGAQFGMRTPGMSGIFHPVVGEGAAYQMQGRQQGMNGFEVAVVGKEDFQGQTAYWIETSFQDPHGGAGASKMLMVMGGPNSGVKRMIVLMNGQAYEFPMDSPMMSGQMSKSAPQDIRNDKAIVRVGTETITVPAGTFSCEHYRSSDSSSEFWISDKVSPWGLVKSVSKDTSMVLARQITGATSKITGPVRPFDPSDFMRQQQHP